MNQIPFSKWSCGGNTTLFFPAAILSETAPGPFAGKGIEDLVAEQAGFIDCAAHSLTMAGGEFCLNATRAFGAQLALEKREPEASVTVSGWPGAIALTCRGQAPLWEVTASLPLPNCPLEHKEPGLSLVRLPGISHLLLDTNHFPLPAQPTAAEDFLHTLEKRFALEAEPCVGLIWWRKTEGGYAIRPLVHVRAAKTLFWEQACGSGSLALALLMAEKTESTTLSVIQPSKAVLLVRASPQEHTAQVSGSARLVCEGHYFPWSTTSRLAGEACKSQTR